MPSPLRHGAHLTGVLLVVTACTVTMSATPAEAKKTYTRSAYAFARATARVTAAATVTVTRSGAAGSITRTATVHVTARATVRATAGAGATAHARSSTRTKAHALAHKRARHIARSRAATKARAVARRRAYTTAHATAIRRATADATAKAEAAARAAAPKPPPTDGPCGNETPVVADAICTFDDEFDETTLDTTKWSAVTTASSSFHGGPECYVDTTHNISVSDGTLKLTARKEAVPLDCYDKLHGDPTTHVRSTQYTAGSVSSIDKFSQQYGQFSIRARFPATTVAGLQSSLWMWPVNQARYGVPWPASGEIDIAEEYSANSTLAIPYLHYSYDPVSTALSPLVNQPTNYCAITPDAFHEYTLAWTTSQLTVSIDGTACLIDNYRSLLGGSAPFDQPFFMILTQGLGVPTPGNTTKPDNRFDPDTTPLPATTEIDYVHVWSQP